MNPNAIVLTHEQFEQLKESIKKDVLSELSSAGAIPKVGVYTDQWISIRTDLERKLRSEFNNGCGHWYQNLQGLYAAFRLAFRKEKATSFRFADQEKMRRFYDELMALIDKYRNGGGSDEEEQSS